MTYNFSLAKPEATGFQMTVSSQGIEKKIDLDPIEFDQVVSYCNRGRKSVNFFAATLYPVRTNTLANFAKDAFLPTVMNHAIKVENTALRVLAIIGALFLDLITSPIRLLAAVPRIVLNMFKGEQILFLYLQNLGHGDVLNSDSVKVSLLQRGLGWQRKEVHFHDFPTASLLPTDYIESGGAL